MLWGLQRPQKRVTLIWGYDIHPQIEIIQTGDNFFQFRAIANNFGFLRFHQIGHFSLSGQHGVQIFTANVERGVGLRLQRFTVVKLAIVNLKVVVIAGAKI